MRGKASAGGRTLCQEVTCDWVTPGTREGGFSRTARSELDTSAQQPVGWRQMVMRSKREGAVSGAGGETFSCISCPPWAMLSCVSCAAVESRHSHILDDRPEAPKRLGSCAAYAPAQTRKVYWMLACDTSYDALGRARIRMRCFLSSLTGRNWGSAGMQQVLFPVAIPQDLQHCRE